MLFSCLFFHGFSTGFARVFCLKIAFQGQKRHPEKNVFQGEVAFRSFLEWETTIDNQLDVIFVVFFVAVVF